MRGRDLDEQVVVVIAAVLACTAVAQWLGWRLHVPAIVFLLASGLIAGPITGALDPGETFGDLLSPFVSLAVAIVLFEGALGLGWKGVRAAGGTVWLLITVGAAITIAGSAVAAHYLIDVDWDMAVLVAVVLVVTGPTVIGPIVRALGLHGRAGRLLEAEGTLIDPLGAVITVLYFQAAFQGGRGGSAMVARLVTTIGIGTGIGLMAAVLLVLAMERYLIPEHLESVTTLAVVVCAFAAANEVRVESGLVAVTAMGVALASQSRVAVGRVLEFNETLRILLVSALFLLLGASIESGTLRELEWRNLAFLAALVIVVRPLSVFVATLGSNLSRPERTFVAATAPRGIVAAAVASLLALQLQDIGVADSQVLVSATFTVIAGTVLLSGLGSRYLANRLGLIDSDRRAMVVLGANPFARQFGSSLEAQGARVRLIDLDRRELSAARMDGLPANRGTILASETWAEAGILDAGCFVAMTSSDELNTLASRQASDVLGRRHVFQIPPGRPEHEAWWTMPAGTFARAPVWEGRDVRPPRRAARHGLEHHGDQAHPEVRPR